MTRRASETGRTGPALTDPDGGQGKGAGDQPVNPREWVRPGGTVVMDDFTPDAASVVAMLKGAAG